MKSSYRYAFIKPEWIVENGKIGSVPAWGSRQAYRVPKNKFDKILLKDETLKPVLKIIEAKIKILYFQHELLNEWKEKLSKEIQKVIDENKIIKIIPKKLESFFKVCFILDHIDKIPQNLNLWLIYLLSYINNEELDLKKISMLIYSIDFIYSKIDKIENNEIKELEKKIEHLLNLINKKYYNEKGFYESNTMESPYNETRFALFSINLLEDIIQDSIYYHNANFTPIKKIYQNVKSPLKIMEMISQNKN